jgi:L-threonylcarbamoyladenylate synthase
LARIIEAALALDEAVDILRAGNLVAVPTETVYGLAADASNGEAVARIFETKGRPRFNPLIAHVSSIDMAHAIGVFDPLTVRLVEAFWPGPLTVVVPLKPGGKIHSLVTAGLDTIALRCPRGFASQVVERLGRPIAAPSANSSGRISATSAQAVAADLGGKIPLIVDAGRTPVGLESTIVKVEDGKIYLLRPGGAPTIDIEQVAGMAVIAAKSGKVQAPGMLLSHYAPKAAIRLNAADVRAGEALLAFGPVRARGADKAVAMLNLSPAGDLREAAANLFDYMNALDGAGPACIAVEPVPHEGLGEAINDRLTRAAAPRDNPEPTS